VSGTVLSTWQARKKRHGSRYLSEDNACGVHNTAQCVAQDSNGGTLSAV